MSVEWQPIRDALANPANNSKQKQEALRRALGILVEAGVEESKPQELLDGHNGKLSNELAQTTRGVISQISPEMPFGSLVLFTRAKRLGEINNLNNLRRFRLDQKTMSPTEIGAIHERRVKMVKELPDPPEEWTNYVLSLGKNTSKLLLTTLRRRLLRQGNNDNYAMSIAEAAQAYRENAAQWTNKSDVFTAFILRDIKAPTS